MNSFKKWSSINCFRIIYFIFLGNLFLEIVFNLTMNDENLLKPIFDLLFCFFLGGVVGSYVTIQSLKYLKNQ